MVKNMTVIIGKMIEFQSSYGDFETSSHSFFFLFSCMTVSVYLKIRFVFVYSINLKISNFNMTPTLVFFCEYFEIFKSSFSYRAPLVAAF